MGDRFEFFAYQHRFKQPLKTAHGVWDVRQGVLVKLSNDQGTGWGEIAPIPWFGSETIGQVLEFCHQLPAIVTDEAICSIPDRLPACQFGFESAWARLHDPWPSGVSHPETLSYSRLLPAGIAALSTWRLWSHPPDEQNICTFKWKIGVYPIAQELEIFEQLMAQLPASTQLRLDANGGLSLEEAEQWLQACDRANQIATGATIEYLEQPLPSHQLQEMLDLGDRYQTLLALDESVANLRDLQTCYDQGWRGVYVIKPAILGSPTRLRQFCQTHSIDAVFSTAFETTIGRQAGLWLAAELGGDRSVGYAGDFHQFDYFEHSSAWSQPA